MKRALLIALDGFVTIMDLPFTTNLIHMKRRMVVSLAAVPAVPSPLTDRAFAKVHETRDYLLFEEQET